MDQFTLIILGVTVTAFVATFFSYKIISSIRKEKKNIIRNNLEDQMKIKARNIKNSDV